MVKLGWFVPDVGPPPPEQSSAVGGGLQTVQYKVGPGWYRIYNATISSSQAYSETARIYMEYEHSDASTSNLFLGQGKVSQNRPFVITNKMVEGPGKLTGSVYLLEATTNFSFVINYRKVTYGNV